MEVWGRGGGGNNGGADEDANGITEAGRDEKVGGDGEAERSERESSSEGSGCESNDLPLKGKDG
jgi:hypothetical protein